MIDSDLIPKIRFCCFSVIFVIKINIFFYISSKLLASLEAPSEPASASPLFDPHCYTGGITSDFRKQTTSVQPKTLSNV
jgi:hypothetical protein